MRLPAFFAFFLMVCILPLAVRAADQTAAPAAKAEVAPKAETTPLTLMNDDTKTLIERMSAAQAQYIYTIRFRHGIIRATQAVERDVGRAIGACGKTQPDMADPLTKRFSDWKTAIDPILGDAEKNLQANIDAQKFVGAGRIRHNLKLVDAAFAFRDRQNKTIPVDTKAGCDYLLKNMDKTQSNLTRLLKETLQSVPLPKDEPQKGPREDVSAHPEETVKP